MITYINEINLAGTVKSLKITKINNDNYCYKFVLEVGEKYTSKAGSSLYSYDYIPMIFYGNHDNIAKEGDNVKCSGRISTIKYPTSEDTNRLYLEVRADKLSKV